MAPTFVYPFPVLIPAGTTQATPLVTPTQFDPRTVERIEWVFPAGCNGQVGIQIGARSVPVIPSLRSQWLTRSGDTTGIDVTGMHETGDWSVIGYNLGAFAHTVQVTFIARALTRVVAEVAPLDPWLLSDYSSEWLRRYG